jgi:hypothetical protein
MHFSLRRRDCPTQAKCGLEWATSQPGLPILLQYLIRNFHRLNRSSHIVHPHDVRALEHRCSGRRQAAMQALFRGNIFSSTGQSAADE